MQRYCDKIPGKRSKGEERGFTRGHYHARQVATGEKVTQHSISPIGGGERRKKGLGEVWVTWPTRVNPQTCLIRESKKGVS